MLRGPIRLSYHEYRYKFILFFYKTLAGIRNKLNHGRAVVHSSHLCLHPWAKDGLYRELSRLVWIVRSAYVVAFSVYFIIKLGYPAETERHTGGPVLCPSRSRRQWLPPHLSLLWPPNNISVLSQKRHRLNWVPPLPLQCWNQLDHSHRSPLAWISRSFSSTSEDQAHALICVRFY